MTNQEAVISRVQLGAAHEGHAELLITLTYPQADKPSYHSTQRAART